MHKLQAARVRATPRRIDRSVFTSRSGRCGCTCMNSNTQSSDPRAGKVGWLLLWLLGIPIPILLILFVMRGCT